MSDKAIKACVQYVEAQAEVKRLTRAIGEALQACMAAHDERHKGWDFEKGEYPPERVSHLKRAYHFEDVDGDEYGGWREYMEPEEQEKFLANNCPHCLAAHKAIQQRKAARKTFGAAKRYIGLIGRAALNEGKETK